MAASNPQSILATPDQIEAERRVLRAVRDPRVREAVASVRESLLADPAARTEVGRSGLDRALSMWLHSLALAEAAGDTSRPKMLWTVEDAPHTWFGYEFPGAAISGDTPDNIYLGSYIDGGSCYELSGRVPPNCPAQFTLEFMHARPGRWLVNTVGQGVVDLGNQIRMIRDEDLRPDAEGRFTITLGPDDGAGLPNHARTVPVPLLVNIRNTLSDWRQAPIRLAIRRTDPAPDGPPLTDEMLVARIAEDLPAWVGLWTKSKETWLGPPPTNTLAPVLARDGGWGFFTSGPYDMADDEALVITAREGGARYFSIQIVDRWYMTAHAGRNFVSRNSSQITQNPDGTITFVLAHRDPGVANWVDPAGAPQGSVLLRWQGIRPGTDGGQLVLSVRLVKLGELDAALPPDCPRKDPAERAAELEQRIADYASRLTAALED